MTLQATGGLESNRRNERRCGKMRRLGKLGRGVAWQGCVLSAGRKKTLRYGPDRGAVDLNRAVQTTGCSYRIQSRRIQSKSRSARVVRTSALLGLMSGLGVDAMGVLRWGDAMRTVPGDARLLTSDSPIRCEHVTCHPLLRPAPSVGEPHRLGPSS